jgi:hypothetical protein
VSPDLDPEKDPQKELELLVAADPYEPRLKPISQDTNLGAKAWKLRTLGDQSDYNPLAKNQNDKVNYGVIVIKSLVWPGLVNVAHVHSITLIPIEQVVPAIVRRLRFQAE